MDAERRPIGDRLDDLLKHAVGEQGVTAIASAASVPVEPSAIRTVTAPAVQAPMYGMYAPAKFITAIEPASGTPTTSAPTPITRALKAATTVAPAK
jgi:hypothetical protein